MYGGFMPDPDGLLIGSGKCMRHIKLVTLEDCPHPALRRFLEQARSVGVQCVTQRRGK